MEYVTRYFFCKSQYASQGNELNELPNQEFLHNTFSYYLEVNQIFPTKNLIFPNSPRQFVRLLFHIKVCWYKYFMPSSAILLTLYYFFLQSPILLLTHFNCYKFYSFTKNCYISQYVCKNLFTIMSFSTYVRQTR